MHLRTFFLTSLALLVETTGLVAQDGHWAYRKPTRPRPPEVKLEKWPHNAVDRFVLARLEQHGVTPSPAALRARQLRRVCLALTGIPPTIEQVDRFVTDASPGAYEKVVNRLLGSDRYGERWAQQWLDLARYADSNGFQADQLRESWAYRDWVIAAFNRDMPFDQFVVEQLAGDLLPDATLSQRIATGFHRTTTCNVEAGVHPEQNRVNQIFDRVDTTGTVFLGTTIECCQCHDHKYDPFTQRDYYRLFAYFNNTPLEVKKVSGVQFDFVGPTMDLPLAIGQQRKLQQLQSEQRDVEAEIERIRGAHLAGFEEWITKVQHSLNRNPPRWTLAPIDSVETSGGEELAFLADGSVLIGGPTPKTSIYRIRLLGPLNNVQGFRIETLTDDSLPGRGPGRGDATRPNFVLSEFAAESVGHEGTVERIGLTSPVADFSQKGWEVPKAIDGNRRTGWGINPQFHKPHWATFISERTIQIDEGDSLLLTLDQNLGQGRTIGRLRVSLLIGDRLSAVLPDQVVSVAKKPVLSKQDRETLQNHYSASNPKLAPLKRKAERLAKQFAAIRPSKTLVMVEMPEARPAHVLSRGNYLDPAEPVEPGTPAVLHSSDPIAPRNRLGLAEWIVSKENPLFARVQVNRWWSSFFGQGLVATPEDFGTQSAPPTHPELLDWLAVEFMESGWSMKHLHKTIVMSSTFRQSARSDWDDSDRTRRLYRRGPRFRLPAETIRDNALAISGLLSTEMYGPPVMPFQPNGIWRAVGRNQPTWKTATDQDRFRRGVYIVWKRGAPYPSFVTLDAPDRASCTVQRPRTNTPLQALTLLNDPAFAEMAMALACRMINEVGSLPGSPEARAAYGFRLCVGRTPSARELRILVDFYEAEYAKLRHDPTLAQQRLKNLLPRLLDPDCDKTELAAWFLVANVLLNLDETLNL